MRVIPADFTAWRQHLGLTKTEAARRLGLAPNSVAAYETGRAKVPTYVALACTALALDLGPWPVRHQAKG